MSRFRYFHSIPKIQAYVRISRFEALKMWTWNNAYVMFAEKQVGSIEPESYGKPKHKICEPAATATYWCPPAK